jgi:hypothetical protein
MTRSVLIFGLILGAIMTANMVYMVNLCYNDPDFESNDIMGYAAMVVIFSMTFFGIRNYRNKQPDGAISLGRAFKIGALIALVGSTIYVAVWLFYYYLFIPDFLDHFIPHMLKETARNGATAAELAVKKAEMEQFRQLYKNPLFVVFVSYFEVLPVGLVVAFVSSLVLKRKPKVPVSNAH